MANVTCVVTQREKEASGLADVPGGAKGKLLEVEYALTEDKKLRGQLRDPSAIEAQVGPPAISYESITDYGIGMAVCLPGCMLPASCQGWVVVGVMESICKWSKPTSPSCADDA
jgi:hypothetical protein